jgi:hypothetical protein
MCTASWLRAGEEFHLLFNRDELRTRARGLRPRRAEADAVPYAAPVDGAAFGTWIAVSSRGMALALLNRTEEGIAARPATVSRGSLIPRLVSAATLDEVEARLRCLDLAGCAPFRLFGRDLVSATPLCWGWNGESIDRELLRAETGLLCSSGLGDARVTRARTPVWERMRAARSPLTVEALRAFHRSHEPERSADSVCMHREDARTVSHSEISIGADEVALRYVDGPPCEGGVVSTIALRREG